MDKIIIKCIQEAIIDYQQWVRRKPLAATSIEAQLNGIVYNKLVLSLRNRFPVSPRRTASVYNGEHVWIGVESLHCTFDERGYLKSVKAQSYFTNPFVEKIQEALPNVAMGPYENPVFYEMEAIVNQIKNYKYESGKPIDIE